MYGIAPSRKIEETVAHQNRIDPVDGHQLADYTGELSAQLEDMAKRYPALSVQTQFFQMSRSRRESIASQTTNDLLARRERALRPCSSSN